MFDIPWPGSIQMDFISPAYKWRFPVLLALAVDFIPFAFDEDAIQ
jgi:hypothetical protein